jgi:hypothetical protein
VRVHLACVRNAQRLALHPLYSFEVKKQSVDACAWRETW